MTRSGQEENLLRQALDHHQAGRLAEARDLYQRILEAAPDHPDVLYFMSVLEQQQVLASVPDDAEALQQLAEIHCDRGNALQTRGMLREALAAYQRALESNPSLARACYAAGCAESSRKEFAAAIPYFTKALEIRPDWPEAQHNLGQALFKLGQIDEALELFRRAAAAGDSELTQSAIAVIIPGSPKSDNAAILETRRSWAARYVGPLRERGARSTDEPVRIGYISSFFQDHNWMKPVWGLINHHDRRLFEVHLLSDAPASKIRHGYQAHEQDRFHDVSALSNDALCQTIEAEAIDLLIDLNGYSDMRRLPLFAMRPAPVVVGWFNIYATTGISGYDYLIGDDVVIPPEEEKFYCEKIVRVPGSYLTFEVGYPVPAVVNPPFVQTGEITFGCLASQYKITSQVIETWSRILHQVPRSSMILRNGAMDAASTRDFMHESFERRGVARERVHLYGRADHFRFLETYSEIDIALDTFPYNGGTTTTEAIWQGVPVVTFLGDRWVSRTSASILQAGGLTELIGRNVDDYVSLAIALAHSRDRLLDLRSNMRSRLASSPVCDTQAFARNMEQIYLTLLAQPQ
jgi:predicted O-linked N-acetylglucosamine transferase (SPINDLY family)